MPDRQHHLHTHTHTHINTTQADTRKAQIKELSVLSGKYAAGVQTVRLSRMSEVRFRYRIEEEK